MKVGFATLSLLALTACAPVPAQKSDSCGLSDHAYLKGQPAVAVKSAGLKQPYRVVPKGSLVTQDYSAARVNFYLDGQGVIIRIACG
jgi:hypothetical protein